MEKQKKTPEQLEVERIEIERLLGRLMQMTDVCPKSVLDDSYQKAVQWKEAAIGARKLAESKSPTLMNLQNAVTRLQPYYAA